MNKIFLPGKPDYVSIKIQTRLGNCIENKQVYDFAPNELNRYKDLEKRYKDARRRNEPNPIYNCHGMTFACGRTQIGDASVEMIINDDGYTEVTLEKVIPGDVVIYYNDNNEPIHSGVVAWLDRIDEEGNIKIPWVVSKWGKYSEFFHHELDCPYPDTKRRYWRMTKLMKREDKKSTTKC